MVTDPVLRRRRCVVAYGAQHLLREAEEVGVVQGLLQSLQRQLAAVGTVDVPVYYRLQTRSAPSWGLNARLMDALSEYGLHIHSRGPPPRALRSPRE